MAAAPPADSKKQLNPVQEVLLGLFWGSAFSVPIAKKLWPYLVAGAAFPADEATAHDAFKAAPLGQLMAAVAGRHDIGPDTCDKMTAACRDGKTLVYVTCAVRTLLLSMGPIVPSPKKAASLSVDVLELSPLQPVSLSKFAQIGRAQTYDEFCEALGRVRGIGEVGEDALMKYLSEDGFSSDFLEPTLAVPPPPPLKEDELPRWVLLDDDKFKTGRDLTAVFTGCPWGDIKFRIPKKDGEKVASGNQLMWSIGAGQELWTIDVGAHVRIGTQFDGPVMTSSYDQDRVLKHFGEKGVSVSPPNMFACMGQITSRGPCHRFAEECLRWAQYSDARWFSIGAGFVMARRPGNGASWEALILFIRPQVHHVQRNKAKVEEDPTAVVQFSLEGSPLFPGVLGVPRPRNATRLLSQTRPIFTTIKFIGSQVWIGCYALPPFFYDGKNATTIKRQGCKPKADTVEEWFVIDTVGDRLPTKVVSSTLGLHPLHPGSAYHNSGAFVVADDSGEALGAFHVWAVPNARKACNFRLFYEELGGKKESLIEIGFSSPTLLPQKKDGAHPFFERRRTKSKAAVTLVPRGVRILAAFDESGFDLHQLVFLPSDSSMTLILSKTVGIDGDLRRTVTTTKIKPEALPHDGARERFSDVAALLAPGVRIIETYVTTTDASSFFVATEDSGIRISRFTYNPLRLDEARPIVDAKAYTDAAPLPLECAAKATTFEATSGIDAVFCIGPQAKPKDYITTAYPLSLGTSSLNAIHQRNLFGCLRVLKTKDDSFLLDSDYYKMLQTGLAGATRVMFTSPDTGMVNMITAPLTETTFFYERGSSPNAKRRRDLASTTLSPRAEQERMLQALAEAAPIPRPMAPKQLFQ